MVHAADGSDARPLAAAAASGTRPTGRQVVLRVAIEVGILAFVFVVFLPRVVDYDAVRAALATLTLEQAALLAAATAIAYIVSAAPIRVLIEGLSWPHAVGADLAARAVASTIPGPTDIVTRFVLYRQWLIPADTATAGILFGGFSDLLAALVMPLIATIGLLVTGSSTQSRVIWLAAAGMVIFAAATLLLAAMVRSESFAERIGQALDRLAHRIWTLARRTPPSGVSEAILHFRLEALEILSRHGLLSLAAAVAARLSWFVVLEICLWAVGLGPDVLAPAVVLAAMAVVGVVGLIPITPGGVGVTELAYIGILSAISAATEQITAAIMLFRIAQWLVPIPLGWVLLTILRRGHWGELLGSPEDAEAATRTPG